MSTRKECIRAASSFTLCTSNINVAGVCFPARYVYMRYVAKVGVGIPKRLIYYEFQLIPTMVSISTDFQSSRPFSCLKLKKAASLPFALNLPCWLTLVSL